MSNVVYPSCFKRNAEATEPWSFGRATVVQGGIYLSTVRMWMQTRKAGPSREFVDFVSEVAVEYLGTNPDILRDTWNTKFPEDKYADPNIPPCCFSEIPPMPSQRSRKTVLRDWLNMTETVVYEGAA